MVAALINGDDLETVLAPDFWGWGSLHPAIAEVARGSWRQKEPPHIRGTGYCVDALEAALWAVRGAGGFEEAVLRAANLGDDADTTAAIAGQLAGAAWGASGIPAHWRSRLVDASRIESLARQLFTAGGGAAPSGWPHDDMIHAWWVGEGLLAGEYPGDRHRSRAEEKLNLLVDAGIRTFVDLTADADALDPYRETLLRIASWRQLNLRRESFPIPDLGVLDDDGYDDILDTIAAAQAHGGVFIHCWGGVGRTGTVVVCWLGRQGATFDEALAALSAARAGTRKAQRPLPESARQRDLLERRLGARP
jgi:protein-tyrosine phosphatase